MTTRLELERIVRLRAALDSLRDPGPLTVRPIQTTGRPSKADLEREIRRLEDELDRVTGAVGKIAGATALLLQAELDRRLDADPGPPQHTEERR